jgi:integrase
MTILYLSSSPSFLALLAVPAFCSWPYQLLHAAGLLRLFGAETSGFDYSAITSEQRKYVQFAVLNHSVDFPLLPLFPVRLASLIRFGWWLPHNGVQAGWDSVSNYIGSVILWARSRGHPDVRTGDEVATWDTFRDNFGRHVKTVRPEPKIPIRIQHLEAISLDADLDSAVDRADMAAYSLLFFASARIGHFSPKSDSPKGRKHLLRWSNVKFVPDIFQPELVFIHVATSKTRQDEASRPWWTAVGRNDRFPRFCPVRLLQLLFVRDWTGDAGDWLLCTPGLRNKPLSRSSFVNRLRTRLRNAAPRLGLEPASFDGRFSSKSFRQGGGTALATAAPGADARLADHMDHTSVDMSRRYTGVDAAHRAEDTTLMAQGFQSAS